MSYGYCPKCGAKGKSRERRPNGNDHCEKGCVYPSKDSTRLPIYKGKPVSEVLSEFRLLGSRIVECVDGLEKNFGKEITDKELKTSDRECQYVGVVDALSLIHGHIIRNSKELKNTEKFEEIKNILQIIDDIGERFI